MENNIKKVTIEEQNKIFLKGLKKIIKTTKGTRILAKKSHNSTFPNMFFITTENKDYNSWIKNAGITEDTELMYRKKFKETESEDFPLIDIAKAYLRAGLCVLPAFRKEKRPALTATYVRP